MNQSRQSGEELLAAFRRNTAEIVEGINTMCAALYELERRKVDVKSKLVGKPYLRSYRAVAEERLSPRAAWQIQGSAVFTDKAHAALAQISVAKQEALLDGEEIEVVYRVRGGEIKSRSMTISDLTGDQFLQVFGPSGIRTVEEQKHYCEGDPRRDRGEAAGGARGRGRG